MVPAYGAHRQLMFQEAMEVSAQRRVRADVEPYLSVGPGEALCFSPCISRTDSTSSMPRQSSGRSLTIPSCAS